MILALASLAACTAPTASGVSCETTLLRNDFHRGGSGRARVYSGALSEPYREVASFRVHDPEGRYDVMTQELQKRADALGLDGVLLTEFTNPNGHFDSIAAIGIVLFSGAAAPAASKVLPSDPCLASPELCHLQKTCDKGYLPSCVALGVAWQEGRVLKADLARGADLFEAACFRGYPLACTHYGFAFYQGTGRAQSDSDAIMHWKSACDAGQVAACRYLGVLYLSSPNVQSLGAYARQFLRQACDGNDGWSCWRLGRMLDRGEYGERGNPDEVRELYVRSCVLGLELGCDLHPSSAPAAPAAGGGDPSDATTAALRGRRLRD